MDQVIMVDDGTGNGIRIPSIMVNKKEGEAILNFMKDASDEILSSMSVVCTFDIDKPSDHVNYDLWVSSSNERGLDFVREFRRYNDLLGDKVTMTPRYFTWACTTCDQPIIETDCVNGGKYCAIDED